MHPGPHFTAVATAGDPAAAVGAGPHYPIVESTKFVAHNLH